MQKMTYAGRNKLPFAENQLERPRLDTLMGEAMRYPFVTVVAGAGYGKTRAVANYLSKKESAVMWISLTEIDNFPLRFWQSFCSAVNRFDAKLYEALTLLGFPDSDIGFERFVTHLNPLTSVDRPLVIVIDDFHLIEDVTVHSFIESLAKERMENMTLILISRKMPQFSATAMFLKNILYYISQDDLRFSREEVSAYFSMLRLKTPESMNEKVLELSEGWASAIYLMGLALIGDPTGKTIDRRIRDAEDVAPNIFNMIESEIFQAFDPGMQEFLIRISLLSSYEPELMKTLSGRNMDPLQDISNDGSFIRYGDYTGAYFIHHLLLAFLQSKQPQLSQDILVKTRKTAADWYLSQQRPLEALEQFLALKDYEGLFGIIFERQEFYTSRHYSGAVCRILDALPETVIAGTPMVLVLYISLLMDCGRLEEAYEKNESLIEKIAEYDALSEEERKACLGEAYAMQGFFQMDKMANCLASWKLSKQCLPNGSIILGPYSPFTFGSPSVLMLYARPHETIEEWMHDWQKSLDIWIFLSHGSGVGGHELMEAEICYYRRQFAKAEELAYASIYKARTLDQVDVENAASFLLMRIAFAKGSQTRAGVFLGSLKGQTGTNSLTLNTQKDVINGWYYSGLSQLENLSAWLYEGRLENSNVLQIGSAYEHLVHGRILLVREEYARLAGFASSTRELLRDKLFLLGEIEAVVQLSIAQNALGQKEEADQNLQWALEQSKRDNLYMSVVEYGKYVLPLLKRIDSADEFLVNLRSYCNTASQYASRLVGARKESSGFGSLSKREKEVLLLLCKGLGRTEIANQLFIAPGTVKSITASIYQKLGVHSAKEAMVLVSNSNWKFE